MRRRRKELKRGKKIDGKRRRKRSVRDYDESPPHPLCAE